MATKPPTISRSRKPSEGPKRLRLAITLSPESRAALMRLQDAGGMAAASFVSHVVHESVPAILGIAEALERAKKSPAQALDVLRGLTQSALHDAAQTQLALGKPRRMRKART